VTPQGEPVYAWDDKTNRPELIGYTVPVTGPSATHYVTDPEGWRQKYHPIDVARFHDMSDVGSHGPRIACYVTGCRNKASENHRDCSSCRSKRLARCVCGRQRSYGAVRCQHCAKLDRKAKPRFLSGAA
jgi:hypothetical protein